jgi:hypothetical protein
VKSQLFGRLAVVLNNFGIGLSLRSAELSPELDNLFAGGLNKFEAPVVLLVNSREFFVKISNVLW